MTAEDEQEIKWMRDYMLQFWTEEELAYLISFETIHNRHTVREVLERAVLRYMEYVLDPSILGGHYPQKSSARRNMDLKNDPTRSSP